MSPGSATAAADEVRAVFLDAGVRGWLHARPVTVDGPDPGEVSVGADVPVVMASVYKLVVLVAWCRAVDEGDLDPREPVTVGGERTPGGTGISALADPVTMSWRDLVTSMITVSDNAAADVAAAFAVLADNDVPVEVRALSPVFGSSTTPADATRLIAMLWRGDLASAAGTAFARRVLSAQIWSHRLRVGFPAAVTVAGKTGTVGAVRNEVGVVTYPGEHPIAVAAFTHAARSDASVPRADAAIGAAARAAVHALRVPRI